MIRSKIYGTAQSLAVIATALTTATACAPSDKQIADWVEKNPEAILKSVESFTRKQREENQPKPEMATTFKSELFERASSPTAGTGSVKIAYFFDFNCGYCAKQSEVIEKVLKEKSSEVTIVYKNFPILSPTSELAARAALAAHQQGKYKDFYREIYASREKSADSMKAIAKKLNLDLKKWETDMQSPAVSSELEHVRDLATKMKIGGTPLLAMGPNTVIPGFVQDLNALLASAKK
jgi:protein-disulfide isomerase